MGYFQYLNTTIYGKKGPTAPSIAALFKWRQFEPEVVLLATDFVFFARRGEMVSNRPEDHEISMLALHLIQNCMVYINTLMIQKVLAQPHWHGRLTPRDYAALTPLIWEHVNPYGRFDLDMNARLALL